MVWIVDGVFIAIVEVVVVVVVIAIVGTPLLQALLVQSTFTLLVGLRSGVVGK